MNCEHVEEILSAYLDNELAFEETRWVTEHLQTCSRCNELLADYRRFDALLTGLPRVSPDPSLRAKIFASLELLEPAGTNDEKWEGGGSLSSETDEMDSVDTPPHLPTFMIGSQLSQQPAPQSSSQATVRVPAFRASARKRKAWEIQHVMQVAIAAALLLTIGVSALIVRNLWSAHTSTAQDNWGSITPPAGLQQGPLAVGVHFVFLRDGALWSGGPDQGEQIVRLTPPGVSVAAQWAVRPALPGRSAGNMIAYIDQQHGSLHTIRSDAQGDIVFQQSLTGTQSPSPALWNGPVGSAILQGLSWSPNGSTLAFVADPSGNGSTGISLYTVGTGTVQSISLPLKGSAVHPVWSADSTRLAFVLLHDGTSSIIDYNTQSRDLLMFDAMTTGQGHTNDSVLALDWASTISAPAVTWSVGVPGHIRSLWTRRVGTEGTSATRVLAQGDYAEASFNETYAHAGGWLLVHGNTGHPGDLSLVDLSGREVILTKGKNAVNAQWIPGQATSLAYLDSPSGGTGTLHVMNIQEGMDTPEATGISATPPPIWSYDGQRALLNTNAHVAVFDLQHATVQTLAMDGPASALTWSPTSSVQAIVATNKHQVGLYAIDVRTGSKVRLDAKEVAGPILWTQIP